MSFYLFVVALLFVTRLGFGFYRVFVNKPRPIIYYNDKADATEMVLNTIMASVALAVWVGYHYKLIGA